MNNEATNNTNKIDAQSMISELSNFADEVEEKLGRALPAPREIKILYRAPEK